MDNALLDALRRHEAEFIALRQDLHRHPELGFQEHRTAGIVAGRLRDWGFEVTTGLAGTGIVGTLRGRRPGQGAIALRADMDALPIREATGLPYASERDGVMHACGHDGHTAMLLAAARHLAENPDFGGTLHVIFQPAEENLGGGRAMVEQGLFDRFPCDAVFGLHNEPGLPVGHFATRAGPMLAAMDSWAVEFRGTGGHGAMPHRATDPTLAQAQFLLTLQAAIGRNIPALEAAVISAGYISAGTPAAPNVIPASVALGGTARTFRSEVRDILERRLRELAEAAALAQGCTATIRFEAEYPVLVNSAAEAARAADAAAALAGEAAVRREAAPITAAEDFAYMLQRRPGAFMMTGNGTGPDGVLRPVHTPLYDFNDAALIHGAAYWVTLARRELA
ncbi:M20 aminoacylase family protein [Pseudoroseomonas sp. WGS1072]|uniref:M20 aminoacylase family protein n=1 Tax=Roseomonas sp. WGS1072 TaxID=3366816 RepID=UPI003BEF94E3